MGVNASGPMHLEGYQENNVGRVHRAVSQRCQLSRRRFVQRYSIYQMTEKPKFDWSEKQPSWHCNTTSARNYLTGLYCTSSPHMKENLML